MEQVKKGEKVKNYSWISDKWLPDEPRPISNEYRRIQKMVLATIINTADENRRRSERKNDI